MRVTNHITNRLKASLLAALTSLGSASTAFAVADYIPLQERAQGQSLAGSSVLNDSVHSNPAGSAFTQVYSVDGTFLSTRSFAVSVLDTKTSSFGGSLGYYRFPVGEGSDARQGLKLGLFGRVDESIGVGLTAKTLWGASVTGENGKRMNDADAGVLVHLGMAQLGATFRNVLGGNPLFNQEREVALGGRIGWEDTIYLSMAAQSRLARLASPYQYGVGAEYVSPFYFSIKGGYRYRTEDGSSFWSAGASLLAPKLSLHYAVEIPQNPGAGLEHVLGATLLF